MFVNVFHTKFLFVIRYLFEFKNLFRFPHLIHTREWINNAIGKLGLQELNSVLTLESLKTQILY